MLKCQCKWELFSAVYFCFITFKRSTDANFFIYDALSFVRKASSEITSAHCKRFGIWEKKIYNEVKMLLIDDITLKLLLRKKNIYVSILYP